MREGLEDRGFVHIFRDGVNGDRPGERNWNLDACPNIRGIGFVEERLAA